MTRFWILGILFVVCVTLTFISVLYAGVTLMQYHAMDRAMVRNTLQINIDREQPPHAQVADVRSDSWQKQ